jgi:hypothetical protein
MIIKWNALSEEQETRCKSEIRGKMDKLLELFIKAKGIEHAEPLLINYVAMSAPLLTDDQRKLFCQTQLKQNISMVDLWILYANEDAVSFSEEMSD